MRSPLAADVDYADWPPPPADALACLSDPVSAWFRYRFGTPTAVQCLAWPHVRAGAHALLSAPTGAGKTLAALLPVLDALLAMPAAGLRCLYVAPLRALGNDVARTLRAHLESLAPFLPAGTVLPRLAVRTGDTPSAERRRFRTEPPDVLLTTPESLAVLLSQPTLAPVFAGLRWLVVDEVHALAPTKRGADLALSLERLDALSGVAVQRLGLSATALPLAEAAGYLVGVGRRCVVVRADTATPLELEVAPLEEGPAFLPSLAARLVHELEAYRSTLIFAGTRRLAERLVWTLRRFLLDGADRLAVHHSALAAERRREVEERFKRGELRAVVCSTSLELGIDMGTVERVVLVHPPGDVVRLLQRVGRAGHGPDGVRRGLVLTAGPAELLEAAVTAASGRGHECEPLHIPRHPLDVLCQQIVGAVAGGSIGAPDALFALARRAYPYRDLTRPEFDDCLRYLLGKDRAGEPWLPARLRDEEGRLVLRDDATGRLLRRNLGTILAEAGVPVLLHGPVDLRPVGEVDEAFAERLQPGDRFLLDGRCLQVRSLDGGVVVEEAAGRPMPPRWAGEGWPLSTELAGRLYVLRVRAVEALREGTHALIGLLRRDYDLGEEAAGLLADHFQRQECLSEVPEAGTCLVEAVWTPAGPDYHVHTPLNRLGNDALARVAVLRLARDFGRSASSAVADLGFVLRVRGGGGGVVDSEPLAVLPALLAVAGFDADLDRALADSPALRTRFGRVAWTGLMLLRNAQGRRRQVGGPDWAARRLFDRVRAGDTDFVLLRQAVREVRAEWCDAAAARAFAEHLPRLTLRCRWLPYVSPFAQGWTQTGAGAADQVETPAQALCRLHAALTATAGPST